MNTTLLRPIILILILLVSACQSAPLAPDKQPNESAKLSETTTKTDTQKAAAEGYILLAPDRGFMGNQEFRELFEDFSEQYSAELVIVSGAKSTRARLANALNNLTDKGAERISVLPLFISPNHPGFTLARAQIEELLSAQDAAAPFSRTLSASYLGVELLSDQLRQIQDPENTHLIVLGYGATDPTNAALMSEDYKNLTELAAAGFGFASADSLVWPDWQSGDKALMGASIQKFKALSEDKKIAVVPFHLGMKLDGMMSFEAMLAGQLPADAQLIDSGPMPNPLVKTWLTREANRLAHLTPEELGVVVLAHGADYDWNEAMREAVRGLEERYMMEYAFSMADREVIEGAIQRLEARGARAIVVVRIFGLASSFQRTVERLIGQDIEGHTPTAHADSMPEMAGAEEHSNKPQDVQDKRDNPHADAHGHAHASNNAPTPRIRSAAITTTLGGLEDHPIFAQALASRLADISQDPSKETLIIVAHGMGSDPENEHWLTILRSLAEQIQQLNGADFRDLKVGTWREDWPAKRAEWVPKIRGWVQEAAQDGGRAIIIPARTNGQGPAAELLEGLDYELSSGFAPHPLFADWFEDQILRGLKQLNAPQINPAPAENNHSAEVEQSAAK